MTGLTALNPFFLSLLPLAALPVLFHFFFRLKKQAHPFPTLMFFHRLDPKLNARLRLRQWLILLLRTLLILFLLLALARPVWFGHGQVGEVAVVLLIDNSGSMSGLAQGGRTKLKQALDGPRDILAELHGSDRAGIVLLVPDPAAPLPAGLTQDKSALKLALDGIAETEASGSVAAALDRALTMLEASPAAHREIQIFSDLQQEKWGQPPFNPPAPPRGLGLVVHRVASPSSALANVSLMQVVMPARPVVAGRRFQVQVRLANVGPGQAAVRLNWLDDAGNRGASESVSENSLRLSPINRSAGVSPASSGGVPPPVLNSQTRSELALPPQEEKNVSATLVASSPGLHWVLFTLDGDDFPADNRAAAAFVAGDQQSVLFVGAPPDFGYLPLALSPTGDARLSGLTTSFSSFDSLTADNPPGFVVLTWDTILQPGADASARRAALRQFLTNGGTALLVPSPGGLAGGGTKPDWLAVSPESVPENSLRLSPINRSAGVSPASSGGVPPPLLNSQTHPESVQASSNGLALAVLDKANAIFDDLRDEKGQIALRNIKVFRFLPLRLGPQAAPVLGLEDGTILLASQKVGQGLLLASGLSFDPAWSTLPLKPAFVALAQGMVLNHPAAQANITSLVAGDPLTPLPNNADSLVVQSLAGSPLDWKGPAAQFTTFPRVGVYALHLGRETRWVAVRSSDKEGRRKFITGDSVAALGNLPYSVDNISENQNVRSDFRRQERSLDLSLPSLLLAFACLALEGWLANPPTLKPRAPATRDLNPNPNLNPNPGFLKKIRMKIKSKIRRVTQKSEPGPPGLVSMK